MPCPNKKRETENKGVSAPETSELPLREELRNVISLMGPETPHTKASDCECVPCNMIEEIYDNKKYNVENCCDEKDNSPPNTPRDFSDYSSFPTDSVEVYVEPKYCTNAKPHEFTARHVSKKDGRPLDKLSNFLGFKCKESKEPLDLYRINILQTKNDSSPPRRVIFDLVEQLPKPCQMNAATNTFRSCKRDTACNPPPLPLNRNAGTSVHRPPGMIVRHQASSINGRSQKDTFYEGKTCRDEQLKPIIKGSKNRLDDMTRVDVYYFDHGNAAYYHTTDSPPVIMTEILAEKTESYTTKFWAEAFGTIHIGFSFFTSFVLQFVRFVFQSFVRPLTIGLIQLCSDYCFKPLLATLFNAVIQPPLILLYNVCTSIRDICDPVAEGFGYFFREVAVIFRAIRFVEVRREQRDNCTQCSRKECRTEPDDCE